MAGYLDMLLQSLQGFGGSAGQQGVPIVGYPEQGGMTNFNQNQLLGSAGGQPGSGFLGGLMGSAQGAGFNSTGFGQVLGGLLRQRLMGSQGGGLANIGLEQLMGGQNGLAGLQNLQDPYGMFPQLQAATRYLSGTAGQPSEHSLKIGALVGAAAAACLAPTARILTPSGSVAAGDLRIGDLVLSQELTGTVVPGRVIDRQSIVLPPTHVFTMVGGSYVSPNHPRPDGTPIAQDGEILALGLDISRSVDILVDSPTGTYCVGGIWLGSTMDPRHRLVA